MRVHAITMGYAPAKILSAGIKRFYETISGELDMEHYVVDHMYPLGRTEILDTLEVLEERYPIIVLSPKENMGLHRGLNWACERIKPEPGDILIVYDPDSYPLNNDWDLAIVQTMRAVPSLAVCGLVDDRIEREINERFASKRHVLPYFHDLVETTRECVISVAGYDWNFIKNACKGFNEPNAFYGGLEAEMWSKLNGRRWGYLPQFREDTRLRDLQDRVFLAYKWAHAHTKTWPGSFEDYLKAGCPGMAEAPEVLP